ncbi:MAG: RsmD family RNA methyltransferase [Candidatus Dojkabacteria bacterium]
MSLKQDSFKKLRKEKNKWRVDTPEEFELREDALLLKKLNSKEPNILTAVRITGGKVKNFSIEIPRATRPMTDRMKIRIFDILKEDIVNKEILDLYAGAGSFGLEALSRGASSATFVDASKNANFVLKKNVAHTGFLTQSDIIKDKVEEYLYTLSNEDKKKCFDIIFIDPPYKLFNTKKTIKMESVILMASEILPGIAYPKKKKFKGALIVKHPKRFDLKKFTFEKIKIIEQIELGLNTITFFIVK